MTKKTLIILIALFGILVTFVSFENGLSKCGTSFSASRVTICRKSQGFTTPEQITLELVVRVAIILVLAGGPLFLLGKRADEKVKMKDLLIGTRKIIKSTVFKIFLFLLIGIIVLLLGLRVSVTLRDNRAESKGKYDDIRQKYLGQEQQSPMPNPFDKYIAE